MVDVVRIDRLFSILNEAYKRYPVHEWKINNIYVWPLIQIRIGKFFFIEDCVKDTIYAKPEGNIGRYSSYLKKIEKVILGELKGQIYDFMHQDRIRRADIVMLCDAVTRNILMPDGSWMNCNIDPLRYKLEENGYTVFSFEELGNFPHYPRWKSTYLIDYEVLRVLIKKYIGKRWRNRNIQIEVDRYQYEEFLKCANKLGMDTSTISLNNILVEVVVLEYLAVQFVQKLKKISPRLIIVETWYSFSKMALCIAAHRLQIPVVEIQHGNSAGGGAHYAYFWPQWPKDRYEVIPDYMWVWDRNDYETMVSTGHLGIKPFIGGLPSSLIFSDDRNTSFLYYQKMYKNLFGNKRPTILLTLSWGVVYPKWLLDFINTSKQYNWLIRLHPVRDKIQRDFLWQLISKDNVKWDGVENVPLGVLLSNVSIHITMLSSVVLEASYYGCPSIVLAEEAKKLFSKQIEIGMTYYVNNSESLSAILKECILEAKSVDTRNIDRKLLYYQGMKGIECIKAILEEKDSELERIVEESL